MYVKMEAILQELMITVIYIFYQLIKKVNVVKFLIRLPLQKL